MDLGSQPIIKSMGSVLLFIYVDQTVDNSIIGHVQFQQTGVGILNMLPPYKEQIQFTYEPNKLCLKLPNFWIQKIENDQTKMSAVCGNIGVNVLEALQEKDQGLKISQVSLRIGFQDTSREIDIKM
jgi:hypothetical protein